MILNLFHRIKTNEITLHTTCINERKNGFFVNLFITLKNEGELTDANVKMCELADKGDSAELLFILKYNPKVEPQKPNTPFKLPEIKYCIGSAKISYPGKQMTTGVYQEFHHADNFGKPGEELVCHQIEKFEGGPIKFIPEDQKEKHPLKFLKYSPFVYLLEENKIGKNRLLSV